MRVLGSCLVALSVAACSSPLDVGTNQSPVDAGDGGQPSPGGPDHGTIGPPDAKRMFVTSASYSGDLAAEGRGVKTPPESDPGADGADKLCAAAAAAASLGGTWRAWISSYTPDKDPAATAHHAIDRIAEVSGGWYNVKRTARLFTSKANLMTAPDPKEWRYVGTGVSFVLDEFGNRMGLDTFTWTGTDTGGRLSRNGATCKAWTTAHDLLGAVGAAVAEASEWTASAQNPCERRMRLYCFEQ